MSKYTLQNVGLGTELDKRFYLEDTVLKKQCSCGHMMTRDLGEHYLSYPVVGSSEGIYFYCDECEAEYDSVKVTVRINLEVEDFDE